LVGKREKPSNEKATLFNIWAGLEERDARLAIGRGILYGGEGLTKHRRLQRRTAEDRLTTDKGKMKEKGQHL